MTKRDYLTELHCPRRCGTCTLFRGEVSRCVRTGRVAQGTDEACSSWEQTTGRGILKINKNALHPVRRFVPYISADASFVSFVEIYDAGVFVREEFEQANAKVFAFSVFQFTEEYGYVINKRAFTRTKEEAEARAIYEPTEQAWPLSQPHELRIIASIVAQRQAKDPPGSHTYISFDY